MKSKRIIKGIPLILSAIILLSACGGAGENEDVNFDDTTTVNKGASISSDAIHDVIKSIPPPVEMTALIKESGAEYDNELLNNTSKVSAYVTTFKKSLNLGVYGADLGYINMYEKTYASIQYLDVVRDIAEDLNIGQFFDFATIKRLATNNKNMDSIVYISTSSFEKMNNYLAKQKRDNISTLMLVGGWIESMHLACKIASGNNNVELKKRVGEQKVALDQVMILLEMFKANSEYDVLYKDFSDLKTIYNSVKITYVYKEPVTKEVDGMLVVEDQSSSEVTITEDQFAAILKKVEAMRDYMIQ